MRIYNHDIMTCTQEQVEGNHLYSGRVLGMTNAEDVIQLHSDLKPEWKAITAHYQRVGLDSSNTVIWDVSLEQLEAYPDHVPSVFYFGDAVQDNSSCAQYFEQLNQDWYQVVAYINSKNNFMRLAQELGVAIPQTHCFEDNSVILGEMPCPCYLKPSVSVDGVGIVRCETKEQLNQAIKHLPQNASFQIQEEIVASAFLNLQYQVGTQGAERLAASEQILDGCAHGGNRFPANHQPWDLVEPMAQWMAVKGMKDVFAFDVAVDERGAEPRYLAIECNPRFNGASYPTGVAHKLGITQWSCETFRTKYHSLDQIDLNGIEYNPTTQTGVILINWGPIQIGKLVILIAGTREKQNHLREQLQVRLAAKEGTNHRI